MHRRQFIASSVGLAATMATPAWAQTYPERPIHITQGFAAGGNADVIARLIGNEMSRKLGQPLVVDAQPGAGGTLAAGNVARSKPDGYSLLLATGGHAVAGALYSKLPYRTVESFEMVSTITFFPFLIVVRADSRYRNLQDVLSDAKARPGTVAFGSAGVGSTHHLAGELLGIMTKVELLHVPYRGDSASTTALLGGEVPMTVAPPTAVLQHIKAGKLRAIAVSSAQRWAQMPDLPTIAEQGVAGYDVRSWAGLMAPAGTSRAVIERLSAEVAQAIKQPNVRTSLEEMGGEPRSSSPEEMKTMVAAELARWTRLVAERNIPRE
jgi:tripartite-type tricarboxylate transporter receptor subunit TctC